MNPAKPNPNASCSEDQASAQRLSRLLRNPAAAPAPTAPAAGYTRLGATLPRPAPVPAAPVPEGPPTRVGAEGWNRLLSDTAAYVGAREVFIVDGSGLPVATLGMPEGFDVERVGSRLALAFDQADRMADQPCRHLTVALGGRTLTGIRLQDPEGGALMLGLLTEGPLPPDRLARLSAP